MVHYVFPFADFLLAGRWAPHRGKIPGSDMELPFECPMDHVFEVETWLKDRSVFRFRVIMPCGVRFSVMILC
jgi:hypothetical protein